MTLADNQNMVPETNKKGRYVDDRVDNASAAAIIGISPARLNAWRTANRGPAWYKIGHRIWYSRGDLAAWIQAQRVAPDGKRS